MHSTKPDLPNFTQRLATGLLRYFYLLGLSALSLMWRARIFAVQRIARRSVSSRTLLRSGFCNAAMLQKLRSFSALPGPSIWIHAVSLGEARAASGLIDLLFQNVLGVKLALTAVTETGFAEMTRLSIGKKAVPLYLPLDLPHLLRPLVDQIDPRLMLFVEGDVWLNLLEILGKREVFAAVVSAHISPRSLRRLRPFRKFLHLYWDQLDLICAQSMKIEAQLRQLGAPQKRLVTAGNLKLSNAAPPLDVVFSGKLRSQMGWKEGDRAIVLASTHEGEEISLLLALRPLLQKYPELHLIIAPRHPHRCRELAKALASVFGPITLDEPPQTVPPASAVRLHLIETTGHLTDCYRLADLAIVGGSFARGIGGHNVFEPMMLGTPVLFGPHMESQLELAVLAKSFGGGLQVEMTDLLDRIDQLLGDEGATDCMRAGCAKAALNARGSLGATWRALKIAGAFSF